MQNIGNQNSVQDTILKLFHDNGASMYGGEAVTQLAHGLQCAHFAEMAGASPALIIAALLHDVGHLLHNLDDNAPEIGIDDLHENLGALFLETYFPPSVTEPVRLHVAAKRYLCSKVEGYKEKLSHPSLVSLLLQGGAMNEVEMAAFEQNIWHNQSVELRLWDDIAKDPTLQTPHIEHFISYITLINS